MATDKRLSLGHGQDSAGPDIQGQDVQGSVRGDVLSAGIDYGVYPITAIFTGGFNMSF